MRFPSSHIDEPCALPSSHQRVTQTEIFTHLHFSSLQVIVDTSNLVCGKSQAAQLLNFMFNNFCVRDGLEKVILQRWGLRKTICLVVFKFSVILLSMVHCVLYGSCDGIHVPFDPCIVTIYTCLLYTSPSPRDGLLSRMPSSA